MPRSAGQVYTDTTPSGVLHASMIFKGADGSGWTEGFWAKPNALTVASVITKIGPIVAARIALSATDVELLGCRVSNPALPRFAVTLTGTQLSLTPTGGHFFGTYVSVATLKTSLPIVNCLQYHLSDTTGWITTTVRLHGVPADGLVGENLWGGLTAWNSLETTYMTSLEAAMIRLPAVGNRDKITEILTTTTMTLTDVYAVARRGGLFKRNVGRLFTGIRGRHKNYLPEDY